MNERAQAKTPSIKEYLLLNYELSMAGAFYEHYEERHAQRELIRKIRAARLNDASEAGVKKLRLDYMLAKLESESDGETSEEEMREAKSDGGENDKSQEAES